MPPKAADVVATAHELLSIARDQGNEDAAWEGIFAKLRKCPGALVRPPPRKMTLLHQAAFWGNLGAVETLLGEFAADPTELTADDLNNDAAGVAESEGRHAVAEVLRAAAAAPKVPVAKAKAKGKAKAKAVPAKVPTDADIALAHELLSLARDNGSEDAVWDSILERLRKQPAAALRPEVRKFSLLHQAAYWGKRAAAEALMAEFGADPAAVTTDGEALDAAAVAEGQGFQEVADFLRGSCAGKGTAAAAAPAPAADAGGSPEEAASAAEEAEAPSPYVPLKADAAADLLAACGLVGAKGCVEVWLRLQADGAGSRWQPCSPGDNAKIHAARSKGAESVKLDDGTLALGTKTVLGADGKHGKAACFKVLWEWDSGEGGKMAAVWTPYPAEAQWKLEGAMCGAAADVSVKSATGKAYVVDLVGLRQYSSTDSFKCRRVRRRGVPLREPFPPKVVDSKTGKWLDLSPKPDFWDAASAAKRFDLPLDSLQAVSISNWMNSTIRTGHAAAYGQCPGHGGPTKGMEVVRIEVVQQPLLWRRYCGYREQLRASTEKAIKGHAGTAYLKKNPMALPQCDWLDSGVMEAYFWHGSGKSPDGSIDLVEAIVSTGHAPSDENAEVMEVTDGASSRFAKHTSMFGAGVYLADIASKANLYVPCSVCNQGSYFRDPCHCSKAACDKAAPYRMLLCRAVLGRVYVEKKYKDERYKGEFNPAKKLGVDSVMGEAVPGQLAFREYVVYNDSATYPEFIVHYRRRPTAVKPLKLPPPGAPPAKKAKK